MAEPKKITAGNSYAWSRSFALYPASGGWSLNYAITSANGHYVAAAVPNGDAFDVTIAPADSAKFEPGAYKLIGYVQKAASDRIVIYAHDLSVSPDFTKAGDFRSAAEKNLVAINAVIANAATKDQASVMVDGQTLTRRSYAELIVLRDLFEREVRREQRAADVASGIDVAPGRVQLRFP